MSIEINEMHAGYGKKPVLKDIDLTIAEGRICALLGHNGSGKTTLMNCINAILKPTRGRVKVMGKEVSKLDRVHIAQLISVVPQSNYSVFPFPVLDMILMGSAARLKAWSSPGKEERNRAYQAMEEVGISDLANVQYSELSGGQQQMVMLCRALYQDTPLMLLDEPNSHLDFCNQHRMMELMKEVVKERGVTALVTLHDPNLALYYCDEIIMLKDGRVVEHGPSLTVMTDANLRRALGDNISIEDTLVGLQVVLPRNLCNCRQNMPNFQKEGARNAV
ncbi:MAG: ABC transporter ATP-binding protein [Syntrophomonas sp.]